MDPKSDLEERDALFIVYEVYAIPTVGRIVVQRDALLCHVIWYADHILLSPLHQSQLIVLHLHLKPSLDDIQAPRLLIMAS